MQSETQLQNNRMEVLVQENVAYNIRKEESVYEMVPVTAPENRLPNVVSKAGKTATFKTIATVATFAFLLASLALLAAAIAIYLSTSGTEVSKASSQDNLQSISTIQKIIQTLQTTLNDSINHLNGKNSEQDTTITALIRTLIWNLGHFWNPVRSCSDLPPKSSSGHYWILNHNNNTNDPVQVYCDINRTSCSCNADGVWMRVANLDLTDPNQNCPAGFQQTSTPLRLCERPGTGCVSTFFPTHGVEYSHVCGRIKAYQKGAPDAFQRYINFTGQTTDNNYVDGISLTHGQSPRIHIWTFAAALNEESRQTASLCSCTRELAESSPKPNYYVPSLGMTTFVTLQL